MNSIHVEERSECVRVASDFWAVEHLRRAGGAWHSIVFPHGSGKNLLRGPAGSALRTMSASTSAAGMQGFFSETNDSAARLSVEHTLDGGVTVIAEGTYRNADGESVPVGFRRRTEYGRHGLIWTTLQIMSDCGCGDVVELRALDMPLRAGLTDGYARFHPTQAGGADLMGGRTWLDLAHAGASTPFLSRFTPLQLACFERGVEGIEVFPGSDLAAWDCAGKPDIGLGMYRIGHDAGGAALELAPYCLAARRMRTDVRGTLTLRLGIALSEARPRAAPRLRAATHAYVSDPATTDAQIEQLAADGVSVICFKDDWRAAGHFWRNGSASPYGADGMRALRALIESCNRCQIKIVPYAALRELHPQVHAYGLHARAWMHAAARSLDVVHNWRADGAGETGAVMCLRSGWLDYRRQTIDAMLRELPWDGVCLDWPGPVPCCHAGHGSGAFHSDCEELLELLVYCRERVGPEGVLAFIASGDSSIVAANLADHILPASE